MTEFIKSDLRVLFEALRSDAHAYFLAVSREAGEPGSPSWPSHAEAARYWNNISPQSSANARNLIDKLLRYSAELAVAVRQAPLAGDEDAADVREATKAIRGALQLRRYVFRDMEVVNDEDRILGVIPAQQSENEGLHPSEAQVIFQDNFDRLMGTLKLIDASRDLQPAGFLASRSEQGASRYRPGTAFIMMWMDPTNSALVDVADAAKRVFQSFGVRAVRADDIEHEGHITEQVLNELRTSEFLFADLTGARPNVYYEVGYAHALGRRVILYRHSGTGIHFDLAGYNCPEYANLRDLSEKLARRLEILTNRTPVTDT